MLFTYDNLPFLSVRYVKISIKEMLQLLNEFSKLMDMGLVHTITIFYNKTINIWKITQLKIVFRIRKKNRIKKQNIKNKIIKVHPFYIEYSKVLLTKIRGPLNKGCTIFMDQKTQYC